MLAPHQTAFVFITLLATFGDQIEDSTAEQCALVSKPIAQTHTHTHTHCEVSNVNWKLAASRHQKAIFRKRAPSFSCFYLASITISGSIRVWIGAQGIATFINIIDPQLRQNDGSCLPANSNLIWFKLTDWLQHFSQERTGDLHNRTLFLASLCGSLHCRTFLIAFRLSHPRCLLTGAAAVSSFSSTGTSIKINTDSTLKVLDRVCGDSVAVRMHSVALSCESASSFNLYCLIELLSLLNLLFLEI